MSTITLTRKIQLLADAAGKEEKDRIWQTLRHWQYACYRAANYIYSHHFLQQQLEDMVYLTDDTRAKLANRNADAEGALCCSRTNTTYRLLNRLFKGEVPMSILSVLNHRLVTTFNTEGEAYRKGERSLRSFKRTIPLPFAPRELRGLHPSEDGKSFTFRFFGLPLRTYLGGDFSDKRFLLQQLTEGKQVLKSSSLVVDGQKLYLLACFAVEKERHPLNEAVLAEVALSPDHPLTVVIGKLRFTIGSRDEFLHRRLAIEAAMQRVQQQSAFNRGKNGRKRKLKSLEGYHQKEKRYVNYRLHVYSRRLIDLCTAHGAGTILLTGQQEKEAAAQAEPFLLRHWSYGGFKGKIAYKAEKAGIHLIVE